jgi:SAM-dependent methyltransferase
MFNRVNQKIFKIINRGSSAPPRRLIFAMKQSEVSARINGVIVDLGAGPGEYLKYFNKNSFGLDITEAPEKRIFRWNFASSVRSEDVGIASIVWCSNLLEHVLAPHEFLLKIKKILSPDGILVIAVPNTSFFNLGPFSGALQADHVNFFTNSTLKLTVEFAGYEILFSGTCSFPKLGKQLAKFGPTIMVIAKPVHNFQYSSNAHKILDKEGKIIFKSEAIGH